VSVNNLVVSNNADMNLKEKIGVRLKVRRTFKGMSLKELSDASGALYSPSRIGNYEQGIRMLPLEVANALAIPLGCSATYLLCYDENETISKMSPAQQELLKAYMDAPTSLQEGVRRLLNVKD
jgi:transcriptional regulator with XRE-family HTH domain